MNGKMVASKPLYVALAQRKEDRRARLQAQFSQMRPIAMAPAVAPHMPMGLAHHSWINVFYQIPVVNQDKHQQVWKSNKEAHIEQFTTFFKGIISYTSFQTL